MSNLERQVSLRKKAANAMERLDALDTSVDDIQQAVQKLAMAASQALNQVNNSLGETRETLDAVIGLVGLEAVKAAIEGSRLERMTTAAEKARTAISEAVTAGTLKAGEKVTEGCLLVGRETRADGTEIPPGYASVHFEQIEEGYRKELLGQGVGGGVATKEGGRFEIISIYENVAPAATAQAETAPAAIPASEVVVEAAPTTEA